MDYTLRKKLSLTILLATAAPCLSAEQLFDETALFDQIPAVISATRVEQPAKDLPVSITVIDRALIEASGAVRVQDLFRLVPGMLSLANNSNGGAVSYHGIRDIFPRRLEVMVNGRAVYWPLLSTVDWGSLGVYLDDIDHIEVVRGSNTPTHGANAFLGAVNIVTRHPLETEGSSVSTRFGSLHSRQYQFQHVENSETFNLLLSANYDRSAGSKALSDQETNRGINFYGEFTPTFVDTVDIQLGGTWGQADWEGIAVDNLFIPRDYNYDYQLLRWTHEDLDGFTHQLTGYRNALNLDTPEMRPVELAGFAGIPQDLAAGVISANPGEVRAVLEHGQTEIRDLEYQLSGRLGAKSHIVSGIGYRQSLGRSPTVLNSESDLKAERWRLFGNLELQPTEPLRLTFGLMAEKGNKIDALKLSPRLAVNYQPQQDLSLRSSYTLAHRIPSMLAFNAELNLQSPLPGPTFDEVWRPNSSLRTERLNAFDIGVLKQWQRYKRQLDIRLFHEKVSRGIDTRLIAANDLADQQVRVPQNGGNWHQQGLEVQFRMRPRRDDILAATYAYIETRGELDKGLGGIEDLASHFPDHSASLLYSHRLGRGLTLGGVHYFVAGSSNWDGEATGVIQRTDLRLAYTTKSRAADWQLELIVQNLFDRDNRESTAKNRLERRGYIRLKARF
ncbi:TonB-dependent receptor plug domain-containing protein [Marinobacterium jannaschii]|uniref:TonB-dependent receptor plug domain-containing protein n=1 Tax=Marinobacterium jannaschii TaxID=64970 RepID=UPI00048A384B|nr:TonB-dependent receptor [Marinobacterium jannaschii]